MDVDEEHYDASPCPTLFVLDGANIAHAGGACVGGGGGTLSSGGTGAPKPAASVAAILAALEFFHSRRFTNTVVFLPAYWLHRKPGAGGSSVTLPMQDKAVLETLVARGLCVLTPPQDHDDTFFLEYGMLHDAWIVSNDRFVDHKRAWASGLPSLKSDRAAHAAAPLDMRDKIAWVEARVISYTFRALPSPPGLEFIPNPAALQAAAAFRPSLPFERTLPAGTLTSELLAAAAERVEPRAERGGEDDMSDATPAAAPGAPAALESGTESSRRFGSALHSPPQDSPPVAYTYVPALTRAEVGHGVAVHARAAPLPVPAGSGAAGVAHEAAGVAHDDVACAHGAVAGGGALMEGDDEAMLPHALHTALQSGAQPMSAYLQHLDARCVEDGARSAMHVPARGGARDRHARRGAADAGGSDDDEQYAPREYSRSRSSAPHEPAHR